MSLLRMSFTGGALVRALALNRLPKRTFLVLWAVAVLRLLTPFTAASALSVYALADRLPPAVQAAPPEFVSPTPPVVSGELGTFSTVERSQKPEFPVLPGPAVAGKSPGATKNFPSPVGPGCRTPDLRRPSSGDSIASKH